MAIQHTITDEGSHVLIVSTGYTPSKQRLNKQTHNLRKLKDGQGVEFLRISQGPTIIQDIYHADVASPVTGNIAALEVVIGPYFFSNAATATMTQVELLAAIAASTLVAGQWVFVSDLNGTDLGGWLFATSENTTALEGVGQFLNCDWDNGGVADYSGVQAVTGVAFGGTNYGQWSIQDEAFTVTYSNLAGGVFEPNDVIVGTSGWEGAVISDNGVDTVTVYSTVGDQPLLTDVLTVGGVTADVDTVGAKTLQGNIYIALGPDLKYHHFQCVDDSIATGDIFTAAYEVLDRSEPNVGYLEVSNKIEFDIANQWLQMRSDSQDNLWRMTVFTNNTFTWGYTEAPFGMFPWGRSGYTNIQILDGDFLCQNLLVAEMFDVVVGRGSLFAIFQDVQVPSVSSIRLGAESELEITIAASFKGLIIADGVSLTNKTYTATISGPMYVTKNDIAVESFAYANWTHDGRRYKEIVITSAELLANLDWGGGVNPFVVLPAITGGYYPRWHAVLENHFGGAAYTNVSPAGFYSQVPGAGTATMLVSLPVTAMNYAGDRVIPNIQPQMNVSHVMPIHGTDEQIIFKLTNSTNQTGGNGYVVIKIWYDTETFAA